TGTKLVIADTFNNRVRAVDLSTGVITTVAGTGAFGFGGNGGAATAAMLKDPAGVVVDSAGNLYIGDSDNEVVRKVDASTGVITTIAGTPQTAGYSGDGGPATAATLFTPWGLALDSTGTHLFIADRDNNAIRAVDLSTGVITTVAGNGSFGSTGNGGPATSAELSSPRSVAVDSSGNLFIAAARGNQVREVDATTGVISLVAGSGSFGSSIEPPATAAQLANPFGTAVDSAGNIYIADTFNAVIRKVNASSGSVSIYA